MSQPAVWDGPDPDRAGIRRSIVHLAWPVVAEQILATLMQMVDTFLVGPLGAVAMAAVGLSVQPLWVAMSLFMGIGAGLAALIARLVGAGQQEDASVAAAQGFWLGLLLAVAAGWLIAWQADAIVLAMGAQPEVAPLAGAFMRLLAPGLACQFWAMIMGAGLRAAGNTRAPFVIGAVINGLNAVLAWALIYGHLGLPAMGVLGAGLATSTARALGAVLLLIVLLHRGTGPGLNLAWQHLRRLRPQAVSRILRVGLPAAAERASSSVAYVLFARLVATLGTVAFAAHHLAVVAENVVWMVAVGLDVATGALVGQGLGAGRPQFSEGATREAVKLSTGLIAVFSLLFLVFPGPYLALFRQDPAVAAAATGALRVAGLTVLPMALAIILFGALRGAGDTRYLLGIALVGGWAVRLGAAAVFVLWLGWGLPGAWAAAGLDWSVRLVLLWQRFRSGRWKILQV